MYLNYYNCEDCGFCYEDIKTSICNDKCFECGTEIEPCESEDITNIEEQDLEVLITASIN